MRILQLTPGTGHFYCGTCLRDGALAGALTQKGHDAVIVPLYLPVVLEETRPDPDERVHMGGINMYLQQKVPFWDRAPRFLANALDRPGLLRWAATKGDMTDASHLGAMTLSMLRGEEGRQARELDRLVTWLASEPRPHVINLSNVMLIGMARRLSEALGAPIVCNLQGEAPFLDGLPQPFRDEAWATLRERAADVDAFIPVSRYYGDLMRERLAVDADRVHVVLNGIDTRDFEAIRPAPTVPTIGYLARMCADKGLPTLVEAFLALKRDGRVPDLRLRVAGVKLDADRHLVGELEERLSEAGVAGDVDFLPNIERAEKLAFLGSLSVLSVPATYGESFGLYTLEALAAGVPLALPHHGAFPEIVAATGGGVLCEPDDPEALAGALERLLTDEPAARAMAERGRAACLERFTLERMTSEVLDVFSKVTAG